MTPPTFLSTTGAAFGFLGGVILAFAASKELTAYRLAISALQLEMMTVREALSNPRSPLISVTGTEKHIEDGVKGNGVRTGAGIACLLLSLALTLGAFVVA